MSEDDIAHLQSLPDEELLETYTMFVAQSSNEMRNGVMYPTENERIIKSIILKRMDKHETFKRNLRESKLRRKQLSDQEVA